MLRTELPFPSGTWRRRALGILLGEPFLGFLAIIATALTLFPMLFTISAAAEVSLEACQWAIIGLFATEYLAALAWAPDRRAFLLDRWRLLDLATILVPIGTLLPNVSSALRSSPLLRLLRIVRIVTLGARASGFVVREQARRSTEAPPAGPAQVTLLRDVDSATRPENVSWQEFLRWVKAPGPEWYHVSNPSPADLETIAATAGLSTAALQAHLLGTGYPHVEKVGAYSGLFVWLPELAPAGQIERHGVFLLIGHDNMLSFSRHSTHLLEHLEAIAPEEEEVARPFSGRMAHRFFHAMLNRNETLVGFFTQELRALEDVPVRESRPQFFERTFRLKKALSTAHSDLWRVKSLLSELADGRARLPGTTTGDKEHFRRLADNAEYLYDTIDGTREEVLSLIDLHLNVVSFDLNRVMRVLAVISALGLLPAVIGGLLGMNLVGNPWPWTLPQVAFSVCLGMVVGLYFFFVKGWLR